METTQDQKNMISELKKYYCVGSMTAFCVLKDCDWILEDAKKYGTKEVCRKCGSRLRKNISMLVTMDAQDYYCTKCKKSVTNYFRTNDWVMYD